MINKTSYKYTKFRAYLLTTKISKISYKYQLRSLFVDSLDILEVYFPQNSTFQLSELDIT